MNGTRVALVAIIAVLSLAAETGEARQTGQQLPVIRPPANIPTGPMGPTVFGRTARDGMTFSGRADTSEQIGPVTTYRGNVAIHLPDTKALLQADEIVYDPDSKEFIIRGDAHLKLVSRY